MMTNAGRTRSVGAEAALVAPWQIAGDKHRHGYTDARFVRYDNGIGIWRQPYPYAPQHAFRPGSHGPPDGREVARRPGVLPAGVRAGRIWWNENTLRSTSTR